MTASVSQREAILQGLLDAGGHVGSPGKVEYVTVSRQLADDATALVQSLGGTARTRGGLAAHRVAYRITICLPASVRPFRLRREAGAYRPHGKCQPSRRIDTITPEGQEESVCLLIDAPDHLYVTRDYIVTHNTLSSLAAAAAADAWPACVVCRPSLTLNWAGEIRRFFPGLSVHVAAGDKPYPVPRGTDIVVIGHAILAARPRTRPGGGKEFGWVARLAKAAPRALIIDEGQDTKEASANRSQACAQLAADVIGRDGLVMDLTGTAIVNRPRELCQQLEVLGRLEELGGERAYANRYCRAPTAAATGHGT